MAQHTFTLVFDSDGKRSQEDFTIDIGDWVEEDFQGGDGEEYLEEVLIKSYPTAELCWIECPEDLPQ
jgi:hypothetical protein